MSPGAGKPQLIQLSKVHGDPETQARVAMNDATVAEYAAEMNAGATFPPIIVVRDGDTYWIVDGYHRVAAARRLGQTKWIYAHVTEGTREDAVWLACGENKTHGLKRTNEDKRRAIKLALGLRPDFTDSRIADHVGVSDKTVAAVRADSGSEIPNLPVRTGRDGKQYPAHKQPAPVEVTEDDDEPSEGATDEPFGEEPSELPEPPDFPEPREPSAPEPDAPRRSTVPVRASAPAVEGDIVAKLRADPLWTEARSIVRAANDLLKRCKDSPAFVALRHQDAAHGVTEFAHAFKLAMPETKCTRKGKHDERCACHGTGWLPHRIAAYDKKAVTA